jgi:thioredoxin-like negative regulator of GroEL
MSARPTAARLDQEQAEKPGLLFFFSARSGQSRRVEGFLAQVLQRRGNHSTFQLHRVDADKHADFATRLKVTDTPALLIVDGGQIRGRVTRPVGCRQIEELLAPWLR